MNAPDLSDPDAAIAALREAGAERLEPVRFHYLAALARRAAQQQESVRHILQERLAEGMTTLGKRLEHAHNEAQDTIARATAQHPQAAGELQRLYAARDFSGLRRHLARLEASGQAASLAELARSLAHQDVAAGLKANIGSPPELKAVRYFRNTWSKLSVDKQVTQAIEQAPENAGPINSHMLVVRSLALMREISPDYLTRFVSYADTLLCLDQTNSNARHAAKKPLKGNKKK